jgi:hypothetical protein
MDEPIVSSFDSSYYSRACIGAALFLWVTGYLLYRILFFNLLYPGKVYLLTAIFIGADYVYYTFFSKSWKRVTVTATEIIVCNVVTKKEITIPYDTITRIGTYRTQGTGRWGYGYAQDIVIEYGDDQSVAFNEAWYDNYNKLTMTIYLHQYGPGHGRDRYLERHGRSE